MSPRSKLLVGIDLGTTHTVVAWADPARHPPTTSVFSIPQLVTPTEVEARPLLPSSLYAPLPGETLADPWSDAPFVIGDHARRRGTEVPARLIASAKSWLCHGAVDRTAAILPWTTSETAADLPRISPLEASARMLIHVRNAWDDAFASYPLAQQDVVLTVPASFDEVARELTLDAAHRAGLSVRLLEEPQAAFYDFMQHANPSAWDALLASTDQQALVLVCDIGGGTTDLSLIRITPGRSQNPVELERVAVGHHLLLGGDNMDLALAYLIEPRLIGTDQKLDPIRFSQLVLACRAAKESLLSIESTADDVSITLLGHGARLVGATLSSRLGREETERIVLEGFFPEVSRNERPQRTKSALVAFGLPYERDVAITRHLAWFFTRHAPDAKGPSAVLLNGGVFRAQRIAHRLTDVISSWGGPPLQILPNADPDLAVARGAVAYGLALLGRGMRIGGGAARGYYVGLDLSKEESRVRQGVCVIPRGGKEAVPYVASGKIFALVVGRPVRFDLFASDDARIDQAGDIVDLDEERFMPLAPVLVAFDVASGQSKRVAPAKETLVRVQLEGELTAIGTLDLACVEVASDNPRRFRLNFQLRTESPSKPTESEEDPHTGALAKPTRKAVNPSGRRLDDAREAIIRVFGKGRSDVAQREVKDLLRELERLLGERPTWATDTARAVFDAVILDTRSRRRSADHERLFWLLAGYCLRPGFGDPGDAVRIAAVVLLLPERVAFSQEVRCWQQFWIAWRRIAGGLDEVTQMALREMTDPFLAPTEKRLKKPKGIRGEPQADLLDLAASLERIPSMRRSELGSWILERTWTDRDPRLWAAIGRIGARVPTYASIHHVVSPIVAERWIDHLLREKWEELPSAVPASVQLCRLTGDRARDVSESIRRDVERRLIKVAAPSAWIRAVREVVAVEEVDRTMFFGEGLPVGLRLLGDRQ